MAKKKHTPKVEHIHTVDTSGQSKFSELIGGKRAVWLYAGIYLIVTVFLFRAFIFSDLMLFGNDTIPDGVYTRQFYKDHVAEYGNIPRWNPLILGGLPFIDAMHGDTFYPAAWLKFLIPLHRALGHKLVWHVFLAGLAMYFFLRTLRLRREASFLGGLMYMLAPSFVTLVYPAHDAKMYVTALLPLAFAFLERGMNRPRLREFMLLGGVMGLLILTSHVQMAYYSYWALGLYFLFRLVTTKESPPVRYAAKAGLFVSAVVIALCLGAVQLLPSYSFTTSQSVRAGEERTSYEYATSWSLHPEEVMGMVVPSFPGFQAGIGDRPETYWGRNPFKLNSEYHGILPLLLAILALLAFRDKRTWFFLGIALLSLVYSLGAETPLYRLFYWFMPGVKNFRAPSMIIFLFAFSIAAMGGSFLHGVLEEKTKLRSDDRRLLIAAGVLIACAVLVSAGADTFLSIWRSVMYPEMNPQYMPRIDADKPFIIQDIWMITLYMAVALTGLWMFLKRRIGVPALVFLLALVVFVDATAVDARFISVINPDTHPRLAPDSSVRSLLAEKENDESFRVLYEPFRIFGAYANMPNYYAMFGLEAADGHHNNLLQSYDLFMGGRSMENLRQYWLEYDNGFDMEGIAKNNFLKVAGVRYLPVRTKEAVRILPNQSALPRARMVHEWVVVPNDTLAVRALRDNTFTPETSAILDADPGIEPSSGSVSSVTEYRRTADGMTATVECAAPGLLVVSENYVPYWKATLDGEPVEIRKAYGTFMAVPCPAGSHTVTFTFVSEPFNRGKMLTFTALFLIIIGIAASGYAEVVSSRKKERSVDTGA